MAKDTKAETTKQRSIQRKVAKDDRASAGKSEKAMQAGARRYPVPPFPKQHQPKPGHETLLDPAPMFDAPYYRGSGKLEGKVALITGGDSGIGRSVAVLFAREGADIAIAHLGENTDAEITKEAVEKEGRKCIILRGDVSSRAHCRKAVETTVKKLGGLTCSSTTRRFKSTRRNSPT